MIGRKEETSYLNRILSSAICGAQRSQIANRDKNRKINPYYNDYAKRDCKEQLFPYRTK